MLQKLISNYFDHVLFVKILDGSISSNMSIQCSYIILIQGQNNRSMNLFIEKIITNNC